MHSILGARSVGDLLFEGRFAAAGEVYVSTDDGSKGDKGFVTDVLKGLNLPAYDRIAVCGPEIMMASVFRLLEDRHVLEKAEFSLHRYFKCGIGVCGACCMDQTGLRVCKDGPVFSGVQLSVRNSGNIHGMPVGEELKFKFLYILLKNEGEQVKRSAKQD